MKNVKKKKKQVQKENVNDCNLERPNPFQILLQMSFETEFRMEIRYFN